MDQGGRHLSLIVARRLWQLKRENENAAGQSHIYKEKENRIAFRCADDMIKGREHKKRDREMGGCGKATAPVPRAGGGNEMIYTVTFNPAIDYVVQLDSPLEIGGVNRASAEHCVLGGKGINVSGVLTELGCGNVALGFVAGETGAWLERGLAARGQRTDFIRLDSGMTRINVKIKGAEETELNGAGPQITPEAMEQLYRKLDALLPGDVLVLAGSIPACLPQDTYQQILTRLKGKGVRTAVDATGQLLMNVLPYRPFLIKPNHHELAELLGRELYGDQEIAGAARVLQQKGARNVLVSMAGEGALLLDEEGWVHRIGTPQGRVVNSVGAGDSMLAGFMAGYLDSGCYDYALRLGTACGSATAFCLGLAQRPQIEQMLTQLEKAACRTAKDAD